MGMDANVVVDPSIGISLSTVYGDQASHALNDRIVDNDVCHIWMKNENLFGV